MMTPKEMEAMWTLHDLLAQRHIADRDCPRLSDTELPCRICGALDAAATVLRPYWRTVGPGGS